MGGTEILSSLVAIKSTLVKETHPRHIFMLTDGAVGSPEDVVQFITKSNFNTRFHAFGIGDGASTYLINESAKAGLGKSYMVPDGDTSLNSKVISALKYACKPAFTSINVDWGTSKSNILF